MLASMIRGITKTLKVQLLKSIRKWLINRIELLLSFPFGFFITLDLLLLYLLLGIKLFVFPLEFSVVLSTF